jgi:S-adenosylmethionine hydrolase
MLEWRSLSPAPDKVLVRGTELSYAYAGQQSRFQIVEVRTRVWDEADQRHYPSTTYHVRDAHTVTDAQVRDGKRPEIVYRSDDPAQCEAFCRPNIPVGDEWQTERDRRKEKGS